MKNEILVLSLIIITIALLALLFVVPAFQHSQQAILAEIGKANHCSAKEDCADAGSKCPFGCYILVNKNEVERIRGLVDSYQSDCIYTCIRIKGFDCIQGKCQVIAD